MRALLEAQILPGGRRLRLLPPVLSRRCASESDASQMEDADIQTQRTQRRPQIIVWDHSLGQSHDGCLKSSVFCWPTFDGTFMSHCQVTTSA
mmetsp:Transcript_534/g.1117  ORF Transcript_534/g.1117 Transcript_534/m.1117 type:complete len:92 (+) Transcript_534:296-571(+)